MNQEQEAATARKSAITSLALGQATAKDAVTVAFAHVSALVIRRGGDDELPEVIDDLLQALQSAKRFDAKERARP